LKDILCVLFVFEHPPADAENQGTMPTNEASECFFIAMSGESPQ
jgi:hypothetical protein